MINLSSQLKGILILLSGTLFFSCNDKAVYDQYQPIDNALWEKNKEYFFSFKIMDLSTPYNLFLEIRNNNLYPYQNLWLICVEDQPIGPLRRDTFQCFLADEFGKWKGNGISLYQSSIPIKSNFSFPHEGLYTFIFKHSMRDSILTGIQEIGFRVEKASTTSRPELHPSEER